MPPATAQPRSARSAHAATRRRLATAAAVALAALGLGPQPAAVAATAAVGVFDDYFTPANVTIVAGDTVEWTWRGGGHNVDVHTGPETFRSAKLGAGATYSHTFRTTGTYSYICDFHSEMAGTIRVTAGPAPPPAEEPAPASAPPPGSETAATGAPEDATPVAGPAPPAATGGPASAAGATGSPAAPRTPAGTPDTTARLLGVSVTRAGLVRLRIAEPGVVTITVRLAGRPVRRLRRALPRGSHSVRLGRRLGRGAYTVTVQLRDRAGNRSRPLRRPLAIRS